MPSDFKVYNYGFCGEIKSCFDISNLRSEGNNEKAATWEEFIEQIFPGEFEGVMQVAPNEVRIWKPWVWHLPKRFRGLET